MRVLIVGAGRLGNLFFKSFSKRDDVEVRMLAERITSRDQFEQALDRHRPEVVINAAGMTRGDKFPNISGCEESPEAIRKCYADNTDLPVMLAEVCGERGIPMVHLSSGNTYNGPPSRVFTESDRPNPVNVYGWSKYLADLRLMQMKHVLILRIMLPFGWILEGEEPEGGDLLRKLGEAEYVEETTTSATFLPDLIRLLPLLIRLMLEQGLHGVLNFVCPQPLVFREVVARYCRIVNPGRKGKHAFGPRRADGIRRSSAVLSTQKLELLLKPFHTSLTESVLAEDTTLRDFSRTDQRRAKTA